jgi:hypothetical protein
MDRIMEVLDASINPTPVDATVSQYTPNYSPDQIKQMQYDLGVIAKENERLRLDVGSLRRQLMEKSRYIESAKDLIVEAFEIDDFDKDLFIAIAETLDIELTKELSVTVNVSFSGTVTVPLGFDMDVIERHIDFEASTNSYTELECDLFTDSIDININN